MSLPELETLCWRCWGNGVVPLEDHGQIVTCPDCSGMGWIPTEDGKKLLEFLQRHLGIGMEDEEDEPTP